MSNDMSHQGYPKIVTVVGAKHNNRSNFMTAAWSTYLSHDPLLFGVSIAPQRFTHDLIQKSGQFNCNFLAYEHTELVHKLGRKSGNRCNKIEELNLEISDGDQIAVPYLSKAYAVIECELHKSVSAGDHTFFMGQIKNAFGKNEAFLENGILDIDRIEPTLYLGSNTYTTASKDNKII